MSRIRERFDQLKNSGRKGFIPFVTAGDPDLDTSLKIILQLARSGADLIEIGVPFSDPMADGPIIQRSSERALAGGTTLRDVLELSSQFRKVSDVPLVLFTYFNPLLAFGVQEFCRSGSGFDGVLLTDVIGTEAISIADELAAYGLDLISLVAPTTSEERLKEICSRARGFIYAISRLGVTGSHTGSVLQAKALVDRIRKFTDTPVAVGFGISTKEQIAGVWSYADAVVIGSAIVAEIEAASSPAAAVNAVEKLMGRLLPQVAKSLGEN